MSYLLLWQELLSSELCHFQLRIYFIFAQMPVHRKKGFSIFPSPAGMSLTKLPLGGNYDVMYKLFRCTVRVSILPTPIVHYGKLHDFLYMKCVCSWRVMASPSTDAILIGFQMNIPPHPHPWGSTMRLRIQPHHPIQLSPYKCKVKYNLHFLSFLSFSFFSVLLFRRFYFLSYLSFPPLFHSFHSSFLSILSFLFSFILHFFHYHSFLYFSFLCFLFS
jgi:hypothetical protein